MEAILLYFNLVPVLQKVIILLLSRHTVVVQPPRPPPPPAIPEPANIVFLLALQE